jgi:hypothetical protein
VWWLGGLLVGGEEPARCTEELAASFREDHRLSGE